MPDILARPKDMIAASCPQRRFATVNYRVAKGSLDHLVGGGEQHRVLITDGLFRDGKPFYALHNGDRFDLATWSKL